MRAVDTLRGPRRSLVPTDSGRSALDAGTRPPAPFRSFPRTNLTVSGGWRADLRLNQVSGKVALVESAQQKLPEAENRLDNAEHRLGS